MMFLLHTCNQYKIYYATEIYAATMEKKSAGACKIEKHILSEDLKYCEEILCI